MVIAQTADRLPQLVFGHTTEDFGGFAVPAAGVMEQQPTPPCAVVRAPKTEMKGDELARKAEGGKLVNDRFTVVERDCPEGLGRHQVTSWEMSR
jgi:hypothetical protein